MGLAANEAAFDMLMVGCIIDEYLTKLIEL